MITLLMNTPMRCPLPMSKKLLMMLYNDVEGDDPLDEMSLHLMTLAA